MTAIETLLADLIDYAGLYPPAGLDMHAAVRKYLGYSRGPRAHALGRFVVDLTRLPDLLEAAGDSIGAVRISLIVSSETDAGRLERFFNDGYRIESIEVKVAAAIEVERIAKQMPVGPVLYCEAPAPSEALLNAVAGAGARIKVRMGGVTEEAFPATHAVAEMLGNLMVHRVAFKATAGLHHPLRGRHTLTYETGSPAAAMHGFVNLVCAAAMLYFGGSQEDAGRLLDEGDRTAWKITPDSIAWRSHRWSADQLRTVRREFLISFGSCSFEEHIRELEELGWL
jgi:hypothetical protein